MNIKLTPKMDARMTKIETDISYIKNDMNELKSSLKDFIEKADSKYSAKWAEIAVKYFITLIVGGVVTALLVGVIKE